MTPEGPLARVLEAAKDVVTGSRTGSAIDRYRTERLWELGDAILSSGMDETALWYSLHGALQRTGVTTQPTLLRNAVRVRKYWPDRDSFLRASRALETYGKLKETISLFNPEIGVPPPELASLLEEVRGKTYSETLDIAARLKARHLHGEDGAWIDPDPLTDSIGAATNELLAAVEEGEEGRLAEIRRAVPSDRSRSLRLLLSALQSPAVRERHAQQLRSLELPTPEMIEDAGLPGLAASVRALTPLRAASPRSLDRIRREVGLSFLGDLATVLKAAESDEERRRFLSNRDVLRRFLAGGTT